MDDSNAFGAFHTHHVPRNVGYAADHLQGLRHAGAAHANMAVVVHTTAVPQDAATGNRGLRRQSGSPDPETAGRAKGQVAAIRVSEPFSVFGRSS